MNTKTSSTDSASSGLTRAQSAKIMSIVFPLPGEQRSRKVVTRSRARSTGKYPSWKMGRMLQWESTNERNAFRLLDCDPAVTNVIEQPCEVRYLHDGVARSHYPDILVETHGRRELWEVKPKSEALRPEIAARSALLTEHLPRFGYVYRVVLGHDLAKQPRLKNAIQLLHFGQRHVTESEQEFIRLALKRRGFLVWSEACAGVYGGRGREIVCRLALTGALALDVDAVWSADTRFTLGKVGL